MRKLLLPLLLVLSSPLAAQETKNTDPWMGMNRKVYAFNQAMDKYVFNPVSRGYQAVTPRVVDHSITRFFGNLGDVSNSLNNLLQFKPGRALSDLGRFSINSTIGIFGIFDVATGMGLEKSDEDFGQTLGVWGIPDGPYLVLPIIGSSSLRDGLGLLIDFRTYLPGYDPNQGRAMGMVAVDFIDTKSDYMGGVNVLNTASPDSYAFERAVYLQRRVDEVYDGNPPAQEEDLDFLMDGDDADSQSQ